MSHQKNSVSQPLHSMSSLQTEPSRMNLQPGVFSSQGIHHSRTPPRANSGWQRKVDILQRDVINQVKHTSSVDAHPASMYAQIHSKNVSGLGKQIKTIAQSQAMDKSPTSSSSSYLKNKFEQQQSQQQGSKVSSVIRRNRLSSYSGTSSLGAIKKGLHFVNRSIVGRDESEKRSRDNNNNNNISSSQQQQQQGRMLRSSSSSLANGQTQQTENYHTARSYITPPENSNFKMQVNNSTNNGLGRNNGNVSKNNMNESTSQPARLSDQEYALRRETDLIESMLMAGEEQQKHTDISIQNARIKAQNVHLKEAVQSLAGELSILSVKMKEQEENIYQQSTYNAALQAQLQHSQQLVSKKDDDLKQLSESLQQSKHTYQAELIRFSEQIQKFRHIQELYASEKHTSQTLEKELILKEQQHCDAEMELKGAMKYLVQLRDHASRKDQLNQQQMMISVSNKNSDSFSFEQESQQQQHRRQKQDGKEGKGQLDKPNQGWNNEEEGHMQCLTIAQKIDQFLQTKQKLLGELDVHYTALQQQQPLNPPSKQQQGYLDMPLQTAILLNAKGTKQQQQQQPGQIQQHQSESSKHNFVPAKKGFSKNNSFQQMMQRQMLAPQAQSSGSFQQSQQQSNSSLSALTRSLTENSRKEEIETDCGGDRYIPLTNRSKQVYQMSQIDESNKQRDLNEQTNNNNKKMNSKQHEQQGLPRTSDFNETFQKIGEVIEDANSLEQQEDNLTFEMDLENSKVSESRPNGLEQQQELQRPQGNDTGNCRQVNCNGKDSNHLPVNITNTLACSSVIEFSNFKHSLEEAIIREGNQQHTPFNSQQLDLSNAVSQYKSQPHEEIEQDKNNHNNMNSNSTAECSSAAGSDAEKESRCISLSNRPLKNKETVKIIGNQSSCSKLPLAQQHNAGNQAKINSKPPIDSNKDKENKCPNGNSINSSNNQAQQIQNAKQVLMKKNHNESVCKNNQMNNNEESTVKKSNNASKELSQAAETTAEVKESQKTAICKYSYSAQKEGDLSFQAGDKIHIIKQTKNGWWIGMVNNQIGYFPFNFVETAGETIISGN